MVSGTENVFWATEDLKCKLNSSACIKRPAKFYNNCCKKASDYMQAFTTNLFGKRTDLTLWFQLQDYAAVFEKKNTSINFVPQLIIYLRSFLNIKSCVIIRHKVLIF